MSRFKKDDNILLIRKFGKTLYDVIASGTIDTECFVVDGIDHYRVNWEDWDRNEFSVNGPFNIICDMKNRKYDYIKAPFKFLK